VRITLAQMDCVLGDVDENAAKAAGAITEAAAQRADLVVLPELALHGYALGRIGEDRSIPAADPRITGLTSAGPDVLVGFHEDGGARTYNAAAHLSGDGMLHLHRKLYLPNYLAWEERKHVSPGQSLRAYDTRFGRMATLLCNDAWQPVVPWLAVQDGAEVLLVAANSAASTTPGAGDPQALDTVAYWRQLLSFTARMQQCWVVFVNRVGEEAGAHFWGGSHVVDPTGEVVAEAPMWAEALTMVDVDVPLARRRQRSVPLVAEARLGLIGREVERLISQGGDA
jgi:N-carbamoylputrescine amidase